MPLLPGSAAIPGNKKLAGLDHLRALAITLVLLFHYRLFPHPAWLDTVAKFGWTGVDLFFVLSGYLISSQLFLKMAEGKWIDVGDFYIRRFFRIIPAYLFVVALYFCIPSFKEWEALPPLWKFLTFTQNIGLDLRTGRTFSHAWSLCIEEQFYLVLPVILAVLVYFKAGKKGAFLLVGLFLAGFAARYYCWQHFIVPAIDTDNFGINWYKYIYYPTWNRLDGLLTGIAIAALFQFRPAIKVRIAGWGNWLILFSLLILVTAYIVCIDEHTFIASVFGFPLVSFAYGLMVAGAVIPSCFLYKRRSWFTLNLATLSYSLYLCHKGVIHLTQVNCAKLGVAQDGNVMFLLCMLSSVVAALLLNQLIELPFLKLRQRLVKSRL